MSRLCLMKHLLVPVSGFSRCGAVLQQAFLKEMLLLFASSLDRALAMVQGD